MEHRVRIQVLAALAVFAFGNTFAAETHSGRASANAAQSGSHASASAAHSVAASGQVTSALSAAPLSVAGVTLNAAGAISAAGARDSMRAAKAPIGTPLPVTDEVITVMPPNEALQQKSKAEKP